MTLLKIILYFVGIAAALYFGVWWAFIGGISEIVNQINEMTAGNSLDAMTVALSVGRIVFAGAIGFVVYALFYAFASMIKD